MSGSGGHPGVGVDRYERNQQRVGRRVDAPADPYVERVPVTIGHAHRLVVLLAVNGQHRVAEGDLGDLERARIETWIERVGNRHSVPAGVLASGENPKSIS